MTLINTESTVMQLPAAFLERLRSEMGIDEARALSEALRGEPQTAVRINPLKTGSLPPEAGDGEPVRWSAHAWHLERRPDFTLMPELHAGALYVQEAASGVHETLVARLTDGAPARVLDLCAAPGGKSIAALTALPQGSLLVSNEVMPQRAAILAENITKWGRADTVVTSAHASKFGALREMFDIMIVDAPCSGEGMMRKDETAVQQWSDGLVESCARLQREILTDALPALKGGGHLIYSTCTFSRRENQETVEWLRHTYGLECVDLLSDRDGVPRAADAPTGCYRFMPHLTRSEGLFVAVMRKPHEGSGASFVQGPKVNKGAKGKKREKQPQSPPWLEHAEWYAPVGCGPSLRMFPAVHIAATDALAAAGIRILQAGVEVAVPKGRDMVPAHALALSTALRGDAFPTVELSRREALMYLNRTLTQLPGETPRGYVAVTYRSLPLGWMKNLGTRANNLYPAQWRIRKEID